MQFFKILCASLMVTALLPSERVWAAEFEISGWIPYWRAESGVASIRPHLGKFTEVNPFIYRVREDGSLSNDSPLSNPEWVTLQTEARAAGVRFIPTVMWSDRDAIDAVLKDPARRSAHVQAIAREVYAYNLDGIDIDYENKLAETRPYFSEFLKELYNAIGFNKWVMCTIEARTPLDSRYSSPEAIPKDIEYSNDFVEINKYCDRVRMMTYDQGRADLKLNDANADPYVPIADPKWVEKVLNLAAVDIAKNKLVVGVPTYGYEHDMFPAVDGSGDMDYAQLWSFNPGYGPEIAGKVGATPARNSAGELSFTFPASKSPEPSIPLPNATRVVTWSDAEAIRQKMELAKNLGTRGVAIFKIDGGQDAGLWNVLASYQVTGVKSAIKPPNLDLAKDEVSGGNTPPTPSTGSGQATPNPTPTTGTILVPTANLSPGSKGEDVRNLQKLLNKHGFTIAASGAGSPGQETTTFGNATYRALIKFQQSKKISPAIGHYGPKTRAALQALI
jgi:spore germination protein